MNPHVTLPERLGKALDAVTDADRAWLKQRVGRRWRISPAEAVETDEEFFAAVPQPRPQGAHR